MCFVFLRYVKASDSTAIGKNPQSTKYLDFWVTSE